MEKKTLTALQGSIAKWEAIVKGDGVDSGAKNCPLCHEFNEVSADEPEWAQDGCLGCPVAERVGDSGCANSEYQAWGVYTWQQRANGSCAGEDNDRRVIDEESKRLAQAEVDFLKSLLPSGGEQGEESGK